MIHSMYCRNKLIVAFVIICGCTSCLSTKTIEKTLPLNNQDKIEFSTGMYENCPFEGCKDYNRSLLANSTYRKVNHDTLNDWDDISVEIKKGVEVLQLNFYRNDTLIIEHELKGKWKNNSFYSKRIVHPRGVPFVYYWYDERKTIFTWFENYMIISKGETRFGMIFIMNAGSSDYTWMRYEEKK